MTVSLGYLFLFGLILISDIRKIDACLAENGLPLADGESYDRDTCTTCICQNGVFDCQMKNCQDIICDNGELAGECCPGCSDPSTQPTKTTSTEPTTTPTTKPTTTQPPPTTIKGTQCIGIDGSQIAEGTKWDPDQCTTCMCENGYIDCQMKYCRDIVCTNSQEKAEECCPRCTDPLSQPTTTLSTEPPTTPTTTSTEPPTKSTEPTTTIKEVEMRDGVCPNIDFNQDTCTEKENVTCSQDGDCQPHYLCCATSCGGTKCKVPALFPEVRCLCPFPKRPIEKTVNCSSVKPVAECTNDTNCGWLEICCKDYCDNRFCHDIRNNKKKDGKCPTFDYKQFFFCDVVGLQGCGDDSDCPGSKKCCPGICTSCSCQDPEPRDGKLIDIPITKSVVEDDSSSIDDK